MPATVVHAEYEKMVSDGDYGRERATASMSYELGEDENAIEVLAVLQRQLRTRVDFELLQSVNLNVRRALQPRPRTCNECGDELGDHDSYVCRDCTERRSARYKRGTTPEATVDGRGNGEHDSLVPSVATSESEALEDLPL